MISTLLTIGLMVGVSQPAFAHGELHDLIDKITREIALKPNNPYLYLNRAELHRGHSDWDAALADLERAEALSNQWSLVHFAKSRLFLSAEWYQSAKVTADRFLDKEPGNLEGLVVRARARVKLADPVGAADDFTRAIAVADPPTPELYLERSQALATAGAGYQDRALQGLEEGLAKLGPIATLQMAAIEMEIQWNRVDAALARVDKIMAQAPRKETWLARRGEILRQAGRNDEAAQAFRAALKELEALPSHRRTVPAMAELENRIRQALAEVTPSAPR
jgi:tetratricopeptide (TPR) repeat protein